MNWWYLIAAWFFILILLIAAFHAMVTIRDMETITFDDDDLYDVDRGRDI